MSGAKSRTGRSSASRAAALRQLAERVGQAALELLGEDDVAEAIPGCSESRTPERRQEGPGSEWQLEIHEDDRQRQGCGAPEDQPAAPRSIPASTARTYSPTGTASRSVSEWLPTASPNTLAAATR